MPKNKNKEVLIQVFNISFTSNFSINTNWSKHKAFKKCLNKY